MSISMKSIFLVLIREKSEKCIKTLKSKLKTSKSIKKYHGYNTGYLKIIRS